MDLETTITEQQPYQSSQENKNTTEGKCVICGKLTTQPVPDMYNKDILEQLYFIDKLSMKEICDKLGVSLYKIYQIFAKYNIKPKTRAEIAIERKNKNHKIKSKPIIINGKFDIILLKERLGVICRVRRINCCIND